MRRLEEAQVRIKIARRNINNLRYVDDTTLMAESEEELKRLLIFQKNIYLIDYAKAYDYKLKRRVKNLA